MKHGKNDDVFEAEEGPSEEKKPRIEVFETSDVSSPTSSLAVENDNGFTVESIEVPAQQLLEKGCTYEQVAYAMRVCGSNASVNKMHEIILDTFYRSQNEGYTLSVSAHGKDKWSLLKGMDFFDEHIDAALTACGEESDIIDLVEFIQAQFLVNDSIVSVENKVCAPQPEGCTSSAPIDEKDKRKFLEAMEFSEEHINAAIKACGKQSDTIDLVEFIQAHFCVNDPCICMENEVCSSLPEGCMSRDVTLVNEACLSLPAESCMPKDSMLGNKACLSLPEGCMSRDFIRERDLSRHLKDMEFTDEEIKAAVRGCGKESTVEEAIDYIQALRCLKDSSFATENKMDSSEDEGTSEWQSSQKFGNSGSTTFGQVDTSDDEDNSGLTTFQKLRNIGFSSSAIQNAMETCESLDFEDLFDFLLEAEPLCGEDIQMEDGCKRLNCGSKGNDEAGPSNALATTSVKWTEDKIRLWYTYIGVKKDHFQDTYKSSRERPWTRKPALVVERGRKKSGVLKFQEQTKISRPEKMRGFAMPGYFVGRANPIPKMMVGPPFFYFENVAGAPKNEWDTIRRHLHDVEIEFTDSKFFSASRRPRGYVHNLPIDGRRLLVPEPPMTIAEALPDTQKYWPWWDTREKLNCINTARASDKLCGMIRDLCVEYNGVEMPSERRHEIIQASKKWNLVWVGPGCVAPLEANEIEQLLGFDKDHTRGFSSMSERYVALGNSFQVNTVAYHLSPLKDLYPNGMTVLSLFSGIGGAEVALHRLGIYLKAVVSVEKHVKTKNVLISWWKKTGQKGELNTDYDNVQDLSYEVLTRIIEDVGRIDLVIGGSPCNNLSGCNRVTRTGLEGKESSLFFEFPRILGIVKQILNQRQYK